MGSKTFDFLTQSFLFEDKLIENKFNSFSDKEISLELQRYRQFCIDNIEAIENEVLENLSLFKVISGRENLSFNLLKQTAFYIEQYIVNDPLFEFGYQPNTFTVAITKSANHDHTYVNKQHLVDILNYIKSLTPFVVANYVKLLPLNYFLEPPERLPFLHSNNSFSDILPEELFEYFSENVIVHSVSRSKENPQEISLNPLSPCREIFFGFKNHTNHGYGYNLHPSNFELVDKEKGEFKMMLDVRQNQEPPDTVAFKNWVNQSFHLSCRKLYDEVIWRNYVASQFNVSYLCESSFVFDLLNQIYPSHNNVETNTANTLFNVELPFLQDIDAGTLMSIRLNEGDVFQTFRTYLDKQFRELRLITEPEVFQVKVENILHELHVVQIQEIKQQIRSIRKVSTLDAVVLLAGLSASVYSFQSGLWNTAIFPLAVAGARGIKPFIDYSNQIKKNPAFFLWKVLKESSK